MSCIAHCAGTQLVINNWRDILYHQIRVQLNCCLCNIIEVDVKLNLLIVKVSCDT